MQRELLEQADRNDGRARRSQHALAIGADECEDIPCGGDGFIGDPRHALEEEVSPRLPVTALSDLAEQAVVLGAVSLEKEAEVEERRLELLPML